MGRIAYLIAHGGLYDANGRSLKVYSYIYSRRENDDDLVAARKQAREDLQSDGLDAGYLILHPYRGAHAKDATPKQCREAMDRGRLSIHFHGPALGYWTEQGLEGQPYYGEYKCLIDIRDWVDSERPIDLRRRLMNILSYDLGHAGYYGDRGQCVTFFGPHVDYKSFIPPQPLIALKHPNATADGEPIWEKRRVPQENVWEDLRAIEAELEDGDEFPRGGQHGIGERIDSQVPWYSLDEIEREEWHENWYEWRASIALAISVLIS